jgi:hypothetical protein
MFDWLDGRAPMLLSARDLDRWPGGRAASAPEIAQFGTSAHGPWLGLSGDGPAAAVPLELGGLLLVSSLRCASEESLSAHLDLLPVSGWTILEQHFVAQTTDFALFDSALPGRDLARKGSRWILVNLDLGHYEVETYPRWSPDASTEVHLVRLIKTAAV